MCELGSLQPVELRCIWPNEAQDFTPWLAEEEHLALLADTLNMRLELESQEVNVGNFRADLLSRNTEDDSLVLIENQLVQTNHKHLGQILTYAFELNVDTVVWIAKEFRREHRKVFNRLNQITEELNELADQLACSVSSLVREMIANDMPRLKERRRQATCRAKRK